METKTKKERKKLVNDNDKQSTRTENVKAYIYHLITYMRENNVSVESEVRMILEALRLDYKSAKEIHEIEFADACIDMYVKLLVNEIKR